MVTVNSGKLIKVNLKLKKYQVILKGHNYGNTEFTIWANSKKYIATAASNKFLSF